MNINLLLKKTEENSLKKNDEKWEDNREFLDEKMPFNERLEVMVWGVICSNGNRALCRVNGKDWVAFMKMIKSKLLITLYLI